jgi:hypothetical protein
MRDKLERAVLALAQPADVQLSLYPDFVCKADELALDFEDGLCEMVGHEEAFSPEQHRAIDALNDLLSSMGGELNAAFWTEDAVRTHPTWDEIRRLARDAVIVCGWELRRPPPPDGTYVRSGGR